MKREKVRDLKWKILEYKLSKVQLNYLVLIKLKLQLMNMILSITSYYNYEFQN